LQSATSTSLRVRSSNHELLDPLELFLKVCVEPLRFLLLAGLEGFVLILQGHILIPH
jgi:hypothetical protein